jgi:signal transduction histidine kinase
MALEAALESATPWAGLNRRDGHTAAPVVTAAVAVVVFVVAVGVSVANPRSGIGAGEYVLYSGWLLCALCGAVLARSPRGRRYGWFLIAVALSAEADGLLGLILHLARTSVWPTAALATVGLAKAILDIAPLTILFTLGLLLFPTGRLSNDARRWRWISGANIIATATLALEQLLMPGTIEDTKLRNPIGIRSLHPVLAPVGVAGFGVLLGCLIAGICAVGLRRRIGNPLERRAVGVLVCAASWVLVVVLLGVVLTVLHRSTPDVVGSSLVAISIAALPAAAVTTTVRRSMFDVELALNRNLTYLALTVIVIGGYALTVTLLGRLFEHRSEFGISLVITGLIAVLFGPLKLAVQQGVEHVLLGRRATPYRALTTLGRRLDGGLSPADALTAAVQTVAETFRLPHAVLTIDVDGEPVTVATYGQPVALPLQYPLLHRGQRRGTLHLAPRSTYEKLTGTDERLLADFITQIAGAVEAVHLTEQLRHSRTAVVMASEEERRRIRRELHDGIGPVLASTALAVQRVERQLDAADPRRASLTETRVDVQHAIDDIRRVVHGLRPAALDELGLAAAITQRAQALCDHVQFEVRIDDSLTGLPAAVEVVAYRVSTEAMTNVVRHAAATNCVLDLCRQDAHLVVRIRDNGHGLHPDRIEGIGLNSMRERLAEIGGRLTITSDERGTELIACLPTT